MFTSLLLGPWPPPESLQPILTSIHISGPQTKKWKANKSYLAEREPIGIMTHFWVSCPMIGCSAFGVDLIKINIHSYPSIGARDMSTLQFLRRIGVKSYFSGCMTLTLATPADKHERCSESVASGDGKCTDVLFVDINTNIMSMFPERVRHVGKRLSHLIQERSLKSSDLRFQGTWTFFILKYGLGV